ncbi:MAG: TolC family protein [Deltaproteobacteria bacterium]|nr:TolC family protein [Deltaproteobacteria bacterium]
MVESKRYGTIHVLRTFIALCLSIYFFGHIASFAQDSPPFVQSVTTDASQSRLAKLVTEALRNNPAIQAARNVSDARREMVPVARTLPDPTLSFQHMGDIFPFRLQRDDPSSARVFSIEQEFPFPGKLGLRSDILQAEYEAENENLTKTRLQVLSELKTAYYNLYLADKSIAILRKNKDLLEDFSEIADTKYQLGQGIQQDVLRSQVEISRVIDRLVVMEQRRGSIEGEINGLLNRPQGSSIAPVTGIEKSPMPPTLDELIESARNSSPSLKIQEQEIEKNRDRVELARKEFYPDFSLGFSYFDRTVPEMYGLMINLRVPLYFWRKQSLELKSAAFELSGSIRLLEGMTASLEARIKDLYLMATANSRLIELYRDGVIPQATLSLESAVAGYQVGSVDFLTVLDSFLILLDYELKYHEALADFQKTLASLEPLTGAELCR